AIAACLLLAGAASLELRLPSAIVEVLAGVALGGGPMFLHKRPGSRSKPQ
ncbi:MAG: hypothetical protein GWN84_26220, partial [Gammaproteobacteria bacterium]|nr:hypothetical protein [Gammaproteobacteria bacterium]NIR85888.1 hypothetical protein [Gammaproteobacteria bacterium]NIU07144.1 hypothetical protein [Gammaproteobacteria bacterium]NIV53957.1 hypothetical protein [Gammaproteobacteria bacterium]NIV76819.1 hypothetical protein [Gammaproteobacteria bacterium]